MAVEMGFGVEGTEERDMMDIDNEDEQKKTKD
jgi:hypothetical protein